MKYKIQRYDRLLKDPNTHAIVYTDMSAYRKYMQSVRIRQKQNDEMRNVIREINILKNDMLEIKSLLKEITNGR